jgi:uncharacterized repeat protein (TIGR03803 family)
LYSFKGGRDGLDPGGFLAMDSSGNVYGTTFGGGGDGCSPYQGCGTIFKISPTGKKTVLYRFMGESDGGYPEGGLVADAQGDLFGVTAVGGNVGNCGKYGCGTIFELTASGALTTRYVFNGGSDGYWPSAGVTLDSAGNIYGTTPFGGSTTGNCIGNGCGVMYKLTPEGTFTTLYTFQGGTDGSMPEAGVIADGAGNFYGTTAGGGDTKSCGGGCGTVFTVTSAGTESVTYAFHRGLDGDYPMASLAMDNFGNLYGTTYFGGGTGCRKDGCGTVFKVAPDGKETVLFAFDEKAQGQNPAAPLLLNGGVLYGTTLWGGGHKAGVVFSVTP